MRDRVVAGLLLLIFLIIAGWQFVLNNRPKVLGIITPTMLEIDFNRNNLLDDGEIICVDNIDTFTSNLTKFDDKQAAKLEIPTEKAIAAGYLADEFASSLLVGQTVKIDFTGEKSPSCRFANIYIDKKNYADILYENGFGFRGLETSENFKNILEQASKLKLIIMNHKSHKYHTLDCKYGRIAHDSVVLQEKEVPKDAKPCKFCHLTKFDKKQLKKQPIIPPPPSIATDGNFKLILTDFTTILKPSRTCSHAVCAEFVKLINEAQSSIDIALYGWADIPRVNNALNEAEKRGVKIRVVYDTSTNKANYYPETENLIKRYENVRSDEIEGSKQLTNMLMHNKFAIFDESKVYTGSMNFSETGLSGFNHNNVIIINSKQIASLYQNEFNQMFEGKFHTLKSPSSDNKNILNGSSEISIFFSPQDKGVTNGVLPIVKNAQKYIYIPTFILTHSALYDELLSAKERGVDIKIIIDATSTNVTHSKIAELRKNGIPVKVENFAGKMHAKSMIIDDEYIVIGSANFSRSGEEKNDENMLVIKNPKFAKLYRDFFEYFWIKIPDKYLKHNVSAESKYSIGSCSDRVDNDFDGKIDKADDGCK